MALIYIRDIPDELKAQFKAYCVRRQKSMRKVVIEFMKEKIAESKNLHPKEKK